MIKFTLKPVSLIIVLATFNAAPTVADTVYCSNCDATTYAVKEVNSSVTAVNSSVTTVNTSVRQVSSDVLKVGQGITDNFSTQNQLLGKIAEAQIKAQRDMIVQQEIARARLRAIETYGDQGTDAYCNDGPGESMSAGRTAMQQAIVSTGQNMDTRSTSGTPTKGSSQKADDLNSIEDDEIKTDKIYPPKNVMTDEQKDLREKITQRIIDPFPPNQIKDNLKKTVMGKRYEATRKAYEEAKLAPRRAASIVQALDARNFEVNQWAKDAWKEELKKSGEPDGAIDGKMSYNSFIELFIRSRIDSDAWYKKATVAGDGGEGGDEVWQLRQVTLNTAMALEIQYQQFQVMQRILDLLTQQQANSVDKQYLPQINELLQSTETEQQ